jgi:endonuclease YncB( thermonuclease family)
MKVSLVIVALALAAAAAARGDTQSEPTPDPCGNSNLVSQGYSSFTGTVVSVLDPVTFLMKADKPRAGFAPMPGCTGKPCKVRLVNLDAPSDPDIAALAKRNLLKVLGTSKRVMLSISHEQDTPGVISALVAPEPYEGGRWMTEVNEAQLEAGLATYRSFGPYAVDWYIACQLKRAQDRAREARLGVWSKP